MHAPKASGPGRDASGWVSSGGMNCAGVWKWWPSVVALRGGPLGYALRVRDLRSVFCRTDGVTSLQGSCPRVSALDGVPLSLPGVGVPRHGPPCSWSAHLPPSPAWRAHRKWPWAPPLSVSRPGPRSTWTSAPETGTTTLTPCHSPWLEALQLHGLWAASLGARGSRAARRWGWLGVSRGVPVARSLRQSQAHAPAARLHTGCSLGAHLWPAVSVGSSSAMCRVGGPGHEPGKTTDTCSPRSRSPVEERGLGVEVVGGAGVCDGVCPPRVPAAGVRARAGRGGRSAALRSVPGQACGLLSCSECPGPAGPAGCVAALSCSPATVFIGQVSSGTGTCADRTSPNPGSCACPGRTAQEAGAPSPRGGWRASGHSSALLLEEEEAEPGALSLAGGRYPRPAAQIALPDTRAPHRPHPPRPRPAAT